MSESNENLCKFCQQKAYVDDKNPSAKYDICIMCYIVNLNNADNSKKTEDNEFKLIAI